MTGFWRGWAREGQVVEGLMVIVRGGEALSERQRKLVGLHLSVLGIFHGEWMGRELR